jgi:hypothetical protein
MNVNYNQFSRDVVILLRENMPQALTTKKKNIILIIVSIAFGYLASCYLARCFCFKNALQNNPKKFTLHESKKGKNEKDSAPGPSPPALPKAASPVATTTIQSKTPIDVKVTEITVVMFCWKDCCLSLQEDHIQHFLGVPNIATNSVQSDPVNQSVLPETDAFVFWNNGEGITRLVPLKMLKQAFKPCRPLSVQSTQVPHDLFSTMFGEIFGIIEGGKTYRVVGGLDSISARSNFLQTRVQNAGILLSKANPVPKKTEVSPLK